MKIKMQLKYKGSRSYLHGSDFFNAISDNLSMKYGGHLGHLALKRFARSQCHLDSAKPNNIELIVGSVSWTSPADEPLKFWLIETEHPVESSYPFDEDSIIALATIEDKAIFTSRNNNYSTIENIIALTKKLNYSLTTQIEGNWLFGQIDLNSQLPKDWTKIKILRSLCIKNSFSLNKIEIDGKNYGTIRFIVGEP